ncbi:Holliday junction branch migration protein RuvA [Chlamydiales bacterium]|nr:Holliday junction branch migration protein RuvA [Chlamydiales bacterium]
MFDYIRGKLVINRLSEVTLDVQGVGYKLFITPTTALPPLGTVVTLFVSFIVREQSQTLYGFQTEEERALFETFLLISGIGPKMALSMIGHLSLLKQACGNQDPGLLSKIPGVGKKTAERLMVELKGKFASIPSKDEGGLLGDALSALVHLGYSEPIAKKALEKSLKQEGKNANLPALITSSLKFL